MQDEEPPLQSELAKPPTAAETPHTLTGALIGAVIVLPEPRPRLPTPVTLPLLPGAPPDTVEVAPPWQPELLKPSSASDRLHRLTGALIGAVMVLPDTPERFPTPVTLPLPPLPPLPPDGRVTLLCAPPRQSELAKPPTAPDTLPFPSPPLPPDEPVETWLLAPPSQPELAKPTIPSDTPQRFTGRLIGA